MTFFEDYINFFLNFYLRLCGVIPSQSFGNHIRLQPPGLGLSLTSNEFITILYHYDNILFCHVPLCNSVPFCYMYRFETVWFNNVPF
jgi:hypothetical protein